MRGAKAALALLLLMPAAASAKQRVGRMIQELEKAKGLQQIPIIRTLGRSANPEAVEPLLRIFDIQKANQRVSAAVIEALGKLKDGRAVDPLIAAWDYLNSLKLQLGGDMPAHLQVMRAGIIESLGEIGAEKASPILLDALGDADALVVERAARALGKAKDKRALDGLIALLGKGGNLAQAGYEALAEIGDARSLSHVERGLSHEDMAVRLQAAYAIARIGKSDQDGEYLLIQVLGNDRENPRTRILAAYYLTKLNSRAGLSYLVDVLERGAAQNRLLAAEALGKSRHKRAAVYLAESVYSSDPQLRTIIARALGHVGGPRAVAALRYLTEDGNAAVKSAARQTLAELGENP